MLVMVVEWSDEPVVAVTSLYGDHPEWGLRAESRQHRTQAAERGMWLDLQKNV